MNKRIKNEIKYMSIFLVSIAGLVLCLQTQKTSDIQPSDIQAAEPTTISLSQDIYMTETRPTPQNEQNHPPEKQPEAVPSTGLCLFDSGISYKYVYDNQGDHMPCYSYIPSTATDSVALPLIVWLHGSGEKDVSESVFLNAGLPYLMKNDLFPKINSYILCPQLKDEFNNGSWFNRVSAERLKTAIDAFVAEYNVDTSRIYITGHSLGGQGALYMAYKLEKYFAACVTFSPYYPNCELSDINIPVLSYVGSNVHGEDLSSYNFALQIASVKGESNNIILPGNHGAVPELGWLADYDNNGLSDAAEWMFQYVKK